MLAGTAILSFLATFVLLRLLLSRFGRLVLDRPNERSLHERPVPRTGGIPIVLVLAASLALGAAPLWLPLAIALGLAAVSFIDDLRGMPAVPRLLAHLTASGVVAWYVLSPIEPLELALIALAIAWITNLYNFMDGSDGLAGGMALSGFGAYAFAAWQADNAPLALVSVVLAASAAAFLLHNFHPARVFLGDVGAIPLGFLAGALGIVGWRDDVWPLWFPLLAFAPFIGDATVTLLRRLLRAERVWQAHRDHYYQRLVRMGLGHRGTAWVAYAAMLACAAAALLGRSQPPMVQAGIFFGTTLALAALAAWIDLRWARFVRGAA